MQWCIKWRKERISRGALVYLPLGLLSHAPLWPAKKSCIRQNAKYCVQERWACQLGREGGFSSNIYSSFAPGPHKGLPSPPLHIASLAALSGSECLWFTLCLWFSNDVWSLPNSWRITNQSLVSGSPGVWNSAGYQTHRFVAAWHWQKIWF